MPTYRYIGRHTITLPVLEGKEVTLNPGDTVITVNPVSYTLLALEASQKASKAAVKTEAQAQPVKAPTTPSGAAQTHSEADTTVTEVTSEAAATAEAKIAPTTNA
jgi:hypothetical protein